MNVKQFKAVDMEDFLQSSYFDFLTVTKNKGLGSGLWLEIVPKKYAVARLAAEIGSTNVDFFTGREGIIPIQKLPGPPGIII